MALTKRTKQGGSYYKGYELIVSSSAGDYILDISETGYSTINSLSITPDTYGAGDTMQLSHMNSGTTDTIAILADSIYNPGANLATMFDFPALEMMGAGEVLRFTYTNTATEALNVHLIVEYVGITKTS